MCIRFLLLVIAVVASTIPTIGEGSIPGFLDPTSTEINRQALAASKEQMGSDNDVVEIQKVVQASNPKMRSEMFRWASNVEVYVLTRMGESSYWCVVKKQDGKWDYLAAYQRSVE